MSMSKPANLGSQLILTEGTGPRVKGAELITGTIPFYTGDVVPGTRKSYINTTAKCGSAAIRIKMTESQFNGVNEKATAMLESARQRTGSSSMSLVYKKEGFAEATLVSFPPESKLDAESGLLTVGAYIKVGLSQDTR
jgi:hypothetical protein